MKAKKLIRSKIVEYLQEGEFETIKDQNELNKLYALKIKEELAEIQASEHKDVMEFADLIQVVFAFAKVNGISNYDLQKYAASKTDSKGDFSNIVLNNLNPENPSNKIYFEKEGKKVAHDKLMEMAKLITKRLKTATEFQSHESEKVDFVLLEELWLEWLEDELFP